MRTSKRCTKCGYSQLFHIPETGHDGLFEAFVCKKCGYTETYPRHDACAALHALPDVRIVGEPNAGPYR